MSTAAFQKYMGQIDEAERRSEQLIKNAEAESEKLRENAQADAKKEIESLRERMTKEFESKKVDNTAEKQALQKQAEQKSAKDSELYAKNKANVIELLVERIMQVEYELPRNVKKDFGSLTGQKQ